MKTETVKKESNMTELICADIHTNCPSGYIEWHNWANDMIKTHKQEKCPKCGLWLVWTRK